MSPALGVAVLVAAMLTLLDAPPWNGLPIPRERRGLWLERHAELVRLAHAAPIDVLFLGDSITDGWRTTGRRVWDTRFAPLRGANFGIGGDATADLLWRIRHGELAGFEPRVIVLLIGTNDLPWSFAVRPSAECGRVAAAAVGQCVAEIQRRQPRAQLLLLAIFPRGAPGDPSREAIQAANAALSRLAGVRYLDLSDRFLRGDALPPELMPDAWHLSERGYAVWGAALEPVVRELLARSPGS